MRTGRNAMYFGVLYGTWSSKCRNWTASLEGPDFKPVRKVLASVWALFFSAVAWNIMDAPLSKQELLMRTSNKYIPISVAWGQVLKEHGVRYLIPRKSNFASCF